jgi:hypothetical protein
MYHGKISNILWFCLVYGVYTTFNNISVISCRSVLLVEETRVLLKKTQTCRKVTDKLSNILLYYKYIISDITKNP